EAGYYEVNWNASNLASGVYIYRLQTGSFVSVKKMMLLR
ncbi:MAG: peptidase S8, partial [Ignavibacteriales bacterium UTCHB2]